MTQNQINTGLISDPLVDIVFIDNAVYDFNHLVAGVSSGAEVVVLDSNSDGVTQITEVLAKWTNIESVHIVSFGSEGSLQLGNTHLDAQTLPKYAEDLQTWGKALTNVGDILLYGCNVAASDGGKKFIQQLSENTGADIAASDDLTGNKDLGGDWELEVRAGHVEAALAFKPQTMQTYMHVFDTFRIDDVTVTEGDSGTTDAVFTVTLATPLEEAASVDLNTVNVSAVAGRDYESTTGTLNFEPGTQEQTVSVPVFGNRESQGDRAFFVNLSNSSENATIGENQGIGIIADDDQLSASVSDTEAIEGEAAAFTVRLSIASDEPVIVQYATASDTAVDGDNFEGISGELTLEPGELEKTVTVETIDNQEINPDREFLLELTAVSGAEIAADGGTATATIADNDLSISGSKWNDLNDDRKRDGGEQGLPGVTIYLDLNDNGDLDDDDRETTTNALGEYLFDNLTAGEYVVREVIPEDFLQSFPLGEVTETGVTSEGTAIQFREISLTTGDSNVTADAYGAMARDAEEGNTFASGIAIRFEDETEATFLTTGEINNSGNLPDPGFTAFTDSSSTSSFNFGGLDFTLSQTFREVDNASVLTQTYFISNPGTAEVNWEMFRYFDDNLLFENSADNGGGRLLLNGQEILFETEIAGTADTETDFVGITATGGDRETSGRYEVNDAQDLVDKIVSASQLNDTVDGDGDDDDEFVDAEAGYNVSLALSNNFSLDLGESTVYTTTTIFGTDAPEDVEVQSEGFYRLTLNPEDPITTADFVNFQITLPAISVENASVEEGNPNQGDPNPDDPNPDDPNPDDPDATANLEFTVELSEPTIVPVTVAYETADLLATEGTDYQESTGTLRFEPGETEKTVTVAVSPDEEVELDETLLLKVSNPDNQDQDEATGTIVNDDLPSLSIRNVQVTEGNSGTNDAEFQVILSPKPLEPVTFNYRTTDGTAVVGSDYEQTTGVLTINPEIDPDEDQITKTVSIPVPIIGDTSVEPDETFSVLLTNITNATPNTVEARGTIINDDDSQAIDLPTQPEPDPAPAPPSLPAFDESFYLAQNPDVANAVATGVFASGLEHYLGFGQFEGRSPSQNFNFDESFYLAQYPDVGNAVLGGIFSTGLAHYIQFGQFEGRLPSPNLSLNLDFDEALYLAQNPDVASAVAAGDFASGREHYLLFGLSEGRSGSPS
ncbi:MAG: DUF4347 domain-containing protein [Hormoscilla sp.]